MSNKTKVYKGHFSRWERVEKYDYLSVAYNFAIQKPEPKNVFAAYSIDGYDGQAFVVTSEDGITFQVVEGSHCSCMGLEDQYDPTPHSVEEIRHMMSGKFNYGPMKEYEDEILAWLTAVEDEMSLT